MKMRLQSVWHVASISIRVYARTCILLAIVSNVFDILDAWFMHTVLICKLVCT